VGESTRNLVPQSPQNLLAAGFAASQAGQRRTNADPHCPQNFFWSATSIAQLLHHIRTSTEVVNIDAALTIKSNETCDPDHNYEVPSRCRDEVIGVDFGVSAPRPVRG
jgi:hypothetical protein